MIRLHIPILILALSLLPCHTASETVSPSDSVSFGIYATYAGTTDPYTVEVIDGEATIQLPDGTIVFISGIPTDTVSLTVYPIPRSDAEAYDWISGCIGDADIYPFLVYLTDSSGNRFNAEDIVITVIQPDPYDDPKAFSLNTDGDTSDLGFTADGNSLTFTADGSEYYILSRELSSTSGNTPQTGDIAYPIFALILSAFLIFKFRRKSR